MATETPERERQGFDFERAYYENLATKADVEAAINGAKAELMEKIAQQGAEWAKMEARITWRIIIAAGAVVAAMTLIERVLG